MSDITEGICTCRDNKFKHPGLPDLPVQGRVPRRSKAQKAEDDKILEEACQAQERAAVEGLQRLSAMQEEMKEAEVQSMMKKPKAVKPRARPVKKKAAPPPADKKLLAAENGESRLQKFGDAGPREDGTVEDQDAKNQQDNTDGEIKTKKKTKKDTSLIKDAARGSQSGARVEDKKGKSSTVTCVSSF